MGVFSAVATWAIFCFSLQLPVKFVLAITPLVVVVDLVATVFLIRQPLRNLRRLRFFAVLRPRFWIELSALALTFGFSFGVLIFTGGAPVNVAWQNLVSICVGLFCASYVLTAVALFVGFLTGRKTTGPSLELVLFFFWCNLATYALDFLFRLVDANAFGLVIVLISLVIAAVAGLMYLVGADTKLGDDAING